MFPKSGAPTEADNHFRALLNISLGSPVKEPSLKVPFIEYLAERSPIPRALLQPSISPRYMNLLPRYQVPLAALSL